ncbi:hypothetical protein OROGR_013087 [Orobanche gracilis]
MLAGCSSTLISPSHKIGSEPSSQFQACQYIPTMSTQRLDLPCSFARKENSRSQLVRPAGLQIEKPIETKATGCSLRQNIKLPPTPVEVIRRGEKDVFREKDQSTKKRYAAGEDESNATRVKRKRADSTPKQEQLGSEKFWFHPGLNPPQVPFSLSCSGDEEGRVCFMPSSIIEPPLPHLSNIPWFNSFVTEITNVEKEKCGSTVKCPNREASGSSSSLSASDASRDLVLGLSSNPTESKVPNRNKSAENVVQVHKEENDSHTEHECVELVSLLVACAEQISSKDIAATNYCLSRLGEIASPKGGTSVHRLVAYYTEALALRVARLWPHIFHAAPTREVEDGSGGTALMLLNQVSPILKFVHFTSNEILLGAFEGKDRIHVIDFDIKQGLQWPSLFQSLRCRTNPPIHVRITGVGESKQELIETGNRLAGFAEALGLPFEFHPVVDRLEDVRLWMLHVKERETVAVNCVFQMHKLLYDETGETIRDFLGLIRSTNAERVVMAEQEADHGEARLDARLCTSLKYYSAIFDMVDSGLPSKSTVRIRVEEMFAREIWNIIGCEGRDRVERHQVFGMWQEVMEQGGFRSVGIGERELLQGRMLLKMYSSCENYGVEKKQGNGSAECLTLSWLDQPLYTVSAWTPQPS